MGSRLSLDGGRESREFKTILSTQLYSNGLLLHYISALCFSEDQCTQGLTGPVEQMGHNREAAFLISFFIHIILDIMGNKLKELQL